MCRWRGYKSFFSCWLGQYERCSCVNQVFVLVQRQTDQISADNKHQSSVGLLQGCIKLCNEILCVSVLLAWNMKCAAADTLKIQFHKKRGKLSLVCDAQSVPKKHEVKNFGVKGQNELCFLMFKLSLYPRTKSHIPSLNWVQIHKPRLINQICTVRCQRESFLFVILGELTL